ncbi:MAG: DUF4202 domain-containing protein [Rhodobacteraceae bacterium]|nr:DUF4202 domain-containing protein [Paracoccaceae bacterium]
MSRLAAVLAAIDAANSADPNIEEGCPASLLYGERMSAELDRLFPDASDLLQIAARGQHVERWKLARKDYPEGRQGYLQWRREQARRHGARLGEMMQDAGYSSTDTARVAQMLLKSGLKRDAEVQALEDVICFTFIRYYLLPFAEGRDQAELVRIVTKSALKMSPEGRARALQEFELPPAFAAAFQ